MNVIKVNNHTNPMMTYNHGLWQSVPVIMMKHNMLGSSCHFISRRGFDIALKLSVILALLTPFSRFKKHQKKSQKSSSTIDSAYNFFSSHGEAARIKRSPVLVNSTDDCRRLNQLKT